MEFSKALSPGSENWEPYPCSFCGKMIAPLEDANYLLCDDPYFPVPPCFHLKCFKKVEKIGLKTFALSIILGRRELENEA